MVRRRLLTPIAIASVSGWSSPNRRDACSRVVLASSSASRRLSVYASPGEAAVRMGDRTQVEKALAEVGKSLKTFDALQQELQ